MDFYLVTIRGTTHSMRPVSALLLLRWILADGPAVEDSGTPVHSYWGCSQHVFNGRLEECRRTEAGRNVSVIDDGDIWKGLDHAIDVIEYDTVIRDVAFRVDSDDLNFSTQFSSDRVFFVGMAAVRSFRCGPVAMSS
ncbi:hypothetical protein FK529_15080 [Tsukamurella asaccharolytica]|uniref:Uncharacterized protein n=1 Tax=Tsukamurella asaccharolytica TaxID=2592067 RepID=A0A5C5R729_9ACTN|nr:hypothetical protein [Tsukamurella asaccharolytica]TWS18422.1 hypothetical protein FK529_15080 [Tsukamurella asaccharolytica]